MPELERAAREHRFTKVEYSVPINGVDTYFEARLAPLGDHELVAVLRNITKAKEAEETLRLSEARYRAIVEDQTELIMRFRKDGVLTFTNEAYARHKGFDRADMIGMNPLDWLPGEDAGRAKELLARLTPDNPVGTIEQHVKSHAGEERWILWTCRAIYEEERFVEYQAVGRDISAQKRMQDRLQKLNECFLSLGKDPHENVARIMESGREILGESSSSIASPTRANPGPAARWRTIAGSAPKTTQRTAACGPPWPPARTR
jgi:PAS domain S-box-containing protein